MAKLAFISHKRVLESEMNEMDMDMIYVEGFEEDFKNNSLPGYYDKIAKGVYARRELSTPDHQNVYCYKLNGRWCLGPHLESERAWAYSGLTEEPPTGQFPWYENRQGKRCGKSTTIKVYPTMQD